MIRRVVQFLDERTGAAPLLRKGLRYVFPDHWSFLLGEVAVYSFMVLVVTGVYISLFFEPSYAETVYHGAYEPLQGFTMSEAYKSVLEISFDVKAGLLMRQTHHWAANVFVAAIVLHLLRVFFTGAFRKPRELTWVVGLLMLFTTLLEGYLGYSMLDDLLSGMGLAIGYAVVQSLPFIGADLALGIWGAPFPGEPAFEPRMYVFHVLILPVAIGTMIAIHLALVASHHHTQFRRTRRQSERKLLGSPLFPAQVPRSLGLLFLSGGLLFLLGGLVQINPIWEWGPYDVALSTNGAQPDWYLGWLIGAMRLVPGFDVTVGEYTLVPNSFWGGALFPLVVFAVLGAYPWVERRITRERGFSNVLDRPRDRPGRTAFGTAFFTWVALILFAGSADRVYVFFGIVDYVTQVWVYRAAVVGIPIVVYFVTRRVCQELERAERIEQDSEQAEAEARAGVATA